MPRAHLVDGRELALELFASEQEERRIMARVSLELSDFQPARDETWWHGVRAGALEPRLEMHELHILPGEEVSAGRMQGYTIELQDSPRRFRHAFSIHSLHSVAQRKMLELIGRSCSDGGHDCSNFGPERG